MEFNKAITQMIDVLQKVYKKDLGAVASGSNEEGMYPFLVPGRSGASVSECSLRSVGQQWMLF